MRCLEGGPCEGSLTHTNRVLVDSKYKLGINGGAEGIANSRLLKSLSSARDCATQLGQSFRIPVGSSVSRLMVCLEPSTTQSSMVRKFPLADWKKACASDGVKILHENTRAQSQWIKFWWEKRISSFYLESFEMKKGGLRPLLLVYAAAFWDLNFEINGQNSKINASAVIVPTR